MSDCGVQVALGEERRRNTVCQMGQHSTQVPLPVCHLLPPPSSQTPTPLDPSEAELEGRVETVSIC